jgi:hypothetical protein
VREHSIAFEKVSRCDLAVSMTGAAEIRFRQCVQGFGGFGGVGLPNLAASIGTFGWI